MSDDIENRKVEVEKLNRLGRLVDRYAQSRSLGLWVGAVMVVINAVVLVGSIELATSLLLQGSSWWLAPLVLSGLWVIISTVWLVWFDKKHGHSFYDRKDGKIEVEREKVPIWAWVAYMITCLGPLILNMRGIMSARWGLTMSLTSFGVFVLYQHKKEKERIVGVVFGGLCVIGAAATALGVPVPLANIGLVQGLVHSYFLALSIYIAAAGLVTMVVVHIYNRKILRKIKEVRPFGEQEANKSDT